MRGWSCGADEHVDKVGGERGRGRTGRKGRKEKGEITKYPYHSLAQNRISSHEQRRMMISNSFSSDGLGFAVVSFFFSLCFLSRFSPVSPRSVFLFFVYSRFSCLSLPSSKHLILLCVPAFFAPYHLSPRLIVLHLPFLLFLCCSFLSFSVLVRSALFRWWWACSLQQKSSGLPLSSPLISMILKIFSSSPPISVIGYERDRAKKQHSKRV